MKPSEMSDHDFGERIGDLYLAGCTYEAAGLAIRAFLAEEQKPTGELEILRAEVSRTAAVVQALATAMPADADRVSPIGGATATWDDLVREVGVLIETRRRQLAIDPILSTPTTPENT